MRTYLAAVLVAFTLLASCNKDQKNIDSYKSHLINSTWWNTNDFSEYNQLHFDSDKTGFMSVANGESCNTTNRFTWSVDANGELSVMYGSNVTDNCGVKDIPADEKITVNENTSSLNLNKLSWTTR
ncbi:hypothetical protein GC194_12680 [bacterium]|nr:hypothetical protein [bacterium]